MSGKKRLNSEWHRENRMPKNPSVEQRISWHREHQANCGCRAIPAKLLALMRERKLG